MSRIDALTVAVQEIPFREWDPLGINHFENCPDEYDSYAPSVCLWLREGIDEFKLAERLSEFRTMSMGLSLTDDEQDRRIARMLLKLVT